MSAFTKVQVLIAEDHPFLRDLLTKQVQQLGYDCYAVSDGTAAVDAAAQTRYQVILMDIEMPELDGLTATKRIREHETISRHRSVIIAVTANKEPKRCLEAGMDDYIEKPAHMSKLQRLIEQWCFQCECCKAP